MSTFWALFRESVIIQGILALAFVGTACYLSIVGQEPPSLITEGMMLILGFFFGSKVAQARTRPPGA